MQDVSLTPGLRGLTSPHAHSTGSKYRAVGWTPNALKALELPCLRFSPSGQAPREQRSSDSSCRNSGNVRKEHATNEHRQHADPLKKASQHSQSIHQEQPSCEAATGPARRTSDASLSQARNSQVQNKHPADASQHAWSDAEACHQGRAGVPQDAAHASEHPADCPAAARSGVAEGVGEMAASGQTMQQAASGAHNLAANHESAEQLKDMAPLPAAAHAEATSAQAGKAHTADQLEGPASVPRGEITAGEQQLRSKLLSSTPLVIPHSAAPPAAAEGHICQRQSALGDVSDCQQTAAAPQHETAATSQLQKPHLEMYAADMGAESVVVSHTQGHADAGSDAGQGNGSNSTENEGPGVEADIWAPTQIQASWNAAAWAPTLGWGDTQVPNPVGANEATSPSATSSPAEKPSDSHIVAGPESTGKEACKGTAQAAATSVAMAQNLAGAVVGTVHRNVQACQQAGCPPHAFELGPQPQSTAPQVYRVTAGGKSASSSASGAQMPQASGQVQQQSRQDGAAVPVCTSMKAAKCASQPLNPAREDESHQSQIMQQADGLPEPAGCDAAERDQPADRRGGDRPMAAEPGLQPHAAPAYEAQPALQSQWDCSETQGPYCTLEGTQVLLSPLWHATQNHEIAPKMRLVSTTISCILAGSSAGYVSDRHFAFSPRTTQ